EARELSLRPAMRGERAGMDRTCQAIQSGRLSFAEVAVMMGGNWSAVQSLLFTLAAGPMERNRAAALRYMTRAAAVTDLPIEHQVAAFKRVEADLVNQPILIRQLGSALSKIAEANVRSHAWLRTA